MAEKVIVSLQAKAGKNPGEAIASHGRSIVFLPRGAEADKMVRVELHELDKTDGRGRVMYRATPAPPQYTQKWKDSGDGTASRVTIATDWLFKESEAGVVETRPLETGEAPEQASTRADRVVVWGTDLASSIVLEEQVTVVPTLAEKVTPQGTLATQKVGEREEQEQPVSYPLTKILLHDCWLKSRRLEVTYEDSWSVQFGAYFQNGVVETWTNVSSNWGKMPDWWKREQDVLYPVCSCGRKRYSTQNPDGYQKCEDCRKEEACIRCGGKKSTVKNLGGRLVCDNCQPYEGAEQMIETEFPLKSREAIALEAKKLCAGQALEAELALAVLRASLGHVQADWKRQETLNRWKGNTIPGFGYRWYYFTDEGVFASKFSPAALQILQFLPQACGNGLVEMAAWLVCGPRAEDFYLFTQVQGKVMDLPSFTEDRLKQIKVADFLRGSEADRIAALAGYQSLVSKLGEESREARAVAEILQEEKQDYDKALAKIREAEQPFEEDDPALESVGSQSEEEGVSEDAIARLKRAWGAK